MGKIVTIEYIDDLELIPVRPEVVDTVEFSYRGQDYSLVLTRENAAKFDRDMSRYITAAKKAQARDARATRQNVSSEPRRSTKSRAGTRRNGVSRKSGSAAPTVPDRIRAIREWAAANGHAVAQRGRIPAAVVDAYNQAH